MNEVRLESDILVAGGGLAGTFAAIAAARQGGRVTLVQDRSVLGGNASSEIAVGIAGADCNNNSFGQYLRETGLINEFALKVLDRSADNDSARAIQSTILWEMVRAEPSITLLLNSYVHHADLDDQGRLTAAGAIQTNTERRYSIKADWFIDCTGHGTLGALAGAEYRMGREGRDEFDESMAPATGDSGTMGDSIIFRARDMGRPVPFTRPDWAEHFPTDADLPGRHPQKEHIGPNEIIGFWWLEYGGRMNTIDDAQEIHEQLTRILFGLWDHMKNTGDHGVDTYALTHIDTIPGRRESRRLMGDTLPTEHDVRAATRFEDRIAYAGWPIDIHPPGGIYDDPPACTHVYLPQVWNLPFRSIYSRNIENLLMAGRNISLTHIALGSARVMATCALLGQAAGTAAAMCSQYAKTPRQIGQDHIDELQQRLLKQDCYLVGISNSDPDDLARGAAVTASSQSSLPIARPAEFRPLDQSLAQTLPLSEPTLQSLELYLRNDSDSPQEVTLALRAAKHLNDFTGDEDLAKLTQTVQPGQDGWVQFDLSLDIQPKRYYRAILDGPPQVAWAYEPAHIYATLSSVHDASQWPAWRPFKPLAGSKAVGTFCLKPTPNSAPYHPTNVISGVNRPSDWTHTWCSNPAQPLPQQLDLTFPEPRGIREVQLTFDDDLNRNIYHPPPHGRIGLGLPESLVKSYRLLCSQDGEWAPLADEPHNTQRHRVHAFSPRTTDAIRLDCRATWGLPQARVVQVRIY